MDESVPANDVCQKIIKSSNKLVKATNIFDVYVGEHVEAGKKSVAINLTFQDDKKTLKEQEINEAMEKILSHTGKHPTTTFFNDSRYTMTFSSTPSDLNVGRQYYRQIRKLFF